MEAGVERFVYASSSSVYGNRPEKMRVEHMKSQPLCPYAAQKLIASTAHTPSQHRRDEALRVDWDCRN